MTLRNADLTIHDLAAAIKPHNDRIVAEHRAGDLEQRLHAANCIIAEQNAALAAARAEAQQSALMFDMTAGCLEDHGLLTVARVCRVRAEANRKIVGTIEGRL